MRTFSLFIHSVTSSTPLMMMEVASDFDGIRTLARRATDLRDGLPRLPHNPD